MAKIAYEDFSGTSTPVTANPYDGIIEACNNDPKLIQARYDLHRKTRNQQQKDKILFPDFPGWILDEVLTKLDGPQRDPNFIDPRNCLVFWARPTQKIKSLIEIIQQKLKHVVPDLWLMPIDNLHMTAMEVTHSLTPSQIDALVDTLTPASRTIADLPSQPGSQARLIKPMLSFDAAALALSFVPAAGEAITISSTHPPRTATDDTFTYHHLRRTLHNLISSTGVPVASRYVVPSAHLTIARFNSPNPFDASNPLDLEAGRDMQKRKKLMHEIETINDWLESEFWPRSAGIRKCVTEAVNAKAGNMEEGRAAQSRDDAVGESTEVEEVIKPGGEWIVGEEKGLDFRKGTLWYGGGETIYFGRGVGQ
ncbi:hypothetical protein PMZ80_007296 [Knufia obscura]|uniref:RNA ligase/cyclic nucleotide phosphodiesterase n=1 Tax=Knufia obscura TaxID=1635080 RepID=A0ABR0RKX7_9EURO|nr:hypothetical protein PMZ80_007296 [Knufia obscura]